MKNSILKLLAIFLVLGLVVSMSACGSNNNSADETSTVTQVASTEAATSSVQQTIDPIGKYDPAIELSTVMWINAAGAFPEGDDITNNIYTRAAKDMLGINIKYNWTVDGAQYANKLNISIASGDIPDFFGCDPKTFISLSQSGQLADLTDVYDTYAAANVKKAADSFPEGFASAKIDGRLMGIPNMGFGTISIPDILWLRDDWLKKFNLTPPQTMDDLINIAQTFKTNIPGAYGIALTKALGSGVAGFNAIANAYHAYPTIWVKDSAGQIVYGSIQPEMKTALKAIQDMYKNGLIDKEFSVKDGTKVNEDMVNGKIGIEFGANWNGYWPLTDSLKKDPNAMWKPYAVPSADGQPVKLQATWPVGGFAVMNKNCKNPEALIKLINLYSNNELLPPDNKTDWQAAPATFTDPMSDYNKHVRMAAAIDAKDPSKLSSDPLDKQAYDNAMSWVDKKDPAGYGAYYQLSSEGAYSVLKKYVDDSNILLTELRGALTPGYAEKKGTLDALEMEAFTKIIMGASIDEFDKFVEKWKQVGGDAATQEINAQFNK